MKKFFLLGYTIGISIFLTFQFVHADFSQRIQINEIIDKYNVVITHPDEGEPYLLHLGSGCGILEAGQTVSLVTKGALNANNDLIKVNDVHRCTIDFAERFTQKLYVKYVFNGNTEAWVVDESDQEYYLSYGPSCSAMPRFRKNHIYVLQGGDKLSRSDKVYLPNKEGQCSIEYLREIRPYRPKITTDPGRDQEKPTTVTHVKAFPRKGRVFLTWRSARDNQEVDHYIVSYNKGNLNPKDIPVVNMPNQIETKNTYLTLKNLTNDETYFFWVAAVDTSGNISDQWSETVQTTPKASILPDPSSPSRYGLNLRITYESDRSYLFEWDEIPGTNRYTVILEVDGSHDMVRTDFHKKRIRILKRPHRQGRPLTFKVRAYSHDKYLGEERINFEF